MYRVELLVRGRLDADWSDWMGGLQITYPAPAVTRLAGTLPDQPALYAVVARLASLNLELLQMHSTPEPASCGQADVPTEGSPR